MKEKWRKLLQRLYRENELRDRGAAYIKDHYGEEYVEEFLDSYDKINKGIPMGNYLETIAFLDLIETIKKETA